MSEMKNASLVVAILLIVFANRAFSQETESAWCKAGTVSGFEIGDEPQRLVDAVFDNCREGDTVQMGPTVPPYFVARICDFSQSIAVWNDYLICVVGRRRSIRE